MIGRGGDIGYEVVTGHLDPGHDVRLRRKRDSYPSYFTDLLTDRDALSFAVFDSAIEEAVAAAEEIARLLTADELDPSDVLVIFPNPPQVSSQAAPLVAELRKRNIASHIAGVTTTADEFFVDNSITISGIYRAKGNEAPFVFLLDAQYCFEGTALAKRRSILFTALTRSRAWIRVFGVGADMAGLAAEYQRVVDNNYDLAFRVPTAEELLRITRVHRDMSDSERRRRSEAADALRRVTEALRSGELAREDVPADMRKALGQLLDGDGDDGD